MKFANCTRNSLLGDIIVSLPFLNYLERCYPHSYKAALIDKKCAEAITPFLINCPLIDKIYVSEERDKVTQKDLDFFNKFDIVFNPFPQHLKEDYYNDHHFIRETFGMNEIMGTNQRIDINEFDRLTPEEQKPSLIPWFDISKQTKTIAIWPFSGYTKNNSIEINLRSPSKEWWHKLVEMIPSDYKIMQFGHPKSELLECDYVIDCRNLSLFEAAKLSMGCDVSISTDSGIGWILGAYGVNQIVLYTNYAPNHITNLDSYVPTNSKNNLISMFGAGGINNINQETVIENIKKFN